MGGMKTHTRIGYFGGTFDPPHLGHCILALEALFQLKLDTLQWILTPAPPHKKNRSITPLNHRLEMLKHIVDRYPVIEISQVDLRRDPPHYAADTVEILKRDNPTAKIIYIIGEDSLRDMPDWFEPARFLAAIDQLAVAPRPEVNTDLRELDQVLPGIKDKTVFISGVMLEISSSVIRERINQQAPYEHFLPDEVAAYIKNNSVYQVE